MRHVAYQQVKARCPKDKLFILDSNAPSWGPLCKFLEVPVPEVPYPHVNESKDFRRRLDGLEKLGRVILGTAAAVGVGALAACVYALKRKRP